MKSRAASPPRRKSCGQCVAAKRRCDLLVPQCTRCFQKNLNCHYVSQPNRRQNTAVCSGHLVRRADIQPILPGTTSSGDQLQHRFGHPPFEKLDIETDADMFAAMDSFPPAIELPNSNRPGVMTWSLASKTTTTAIVYRSEDYDMVNHICVRKHLDASLHYTS